MYRELKKKSFVYLVCLHTHTHTLKIIFWSRNKGKENTNILMSHGKFLCENVNEFQLNKTHKNIHEPILYEKKRKFRNLDYSVLYIFYWILFCTFNLFFGKKVRNFFKILEIYRNFSSGKNSHIIFLFFFFGILWPHNLFLFN